MLFVRAKRSRNRDHTQRGPRCVVKRCGGDEKPMGAVYNFLVQDLFEPNASLYSSAVAHCQKVKWILSGFAAPCHYKLRRCRCSPRSKEQLASFSPSIAGGGCSRGPPNVRLLKKSQVSRALALPQRWGIE